MSAVCTWNVDWASTTTDSADPPMMVLQVGWRVTGTQESDGKVYTGTVYSTCSLPPANPADFIAYQDLTQDTVLGWCWENGVNKASAEAAVQQQIERQINPPTIQPKLPWAA